MWSRMSQYGVPRACQRPVRLGLPSGMRGIRAACDCPKAGMTRAARVIEMPNRRCINRSPIGMLVTKAAGVKIFTFKGRRVYNRAHPEVRLKPDTTYRRVRLKPDTTY